jgi:hypothetical protein
MDTRRFDKATANLRQTFERMGAALHPVKPAGPTKVELAPIIGAIAERIPPMPIQRVHEALIERIKGD